MTAFDRNSTRRNYFDGSDIAVSKDLHGLDDFDVLIEATGDPEVLHTVLCARMAGPTAGLSHRRSSPAADNSSCGSDGFLAEALSTGYRWAYLGSNYCQMLGLEHGSLQKLSRLHLSARLQAAAERSRKTFIQWMGELGRKQNSLARWARPAADKHPEHSAFFRQLCYLQVGLELASEYQDSGILLVVESDAVRDQMAQCLGDGETALLFRTETHQRVSRVFRRTGRLARAHVTYLWQRLCELDATRRMPRLRSQAAIPRPEAVLVSYVDDSVLSAEGRLLDRYFGVLPAWLCEQGYQASWVPFIYQYSVPWPEMVRRVRAPSACTLCRTTCRRVTICGPACGPFLRGGPPW